MIHSNNGSFKLIVTSSIWIVMQTRIALISFVPVKF